MSGSHLVQQSVSRIEDNLIWVKSVRDSIFAWWFNFALLFIVIGSFVFFLYSGYNTAVPEELQKIPFQPRTWNNAVRNVPTSDYKQIPQIDSGIGIQGISEKINGSIF